MDSIETNGNAPAPLILDPSHQKIADLLKIIETNGMPLSQWYIGSLYALHNPHNPDRYSQAAQSLRELVEKIPRVIKSDSVQEIGPGFPEIRKSLHGRFTKDKKRYSEVWVDKKIDTGLNKTLIGIGSYLDLNQKPNRKEQLKNTLINHDPMALELGQQLLQQKRDSFSRLWEELESFAHHKKPTNDAQFRPLFDAFNKLIFDLLAPVTADDQKDIRDILFHSAKTNDDIVKLLTLIGRRGANYVYFFNNCADPFWIKPLKENGLLDNPPDVEPIGDGRVRVPIWWPIAYLHKLAPDHGVLVAGVLNDLPKIDNPRILADIARIVAIINPRTEGLSLKSFLISYVKSTRGWIDNDIIVKILNDWSAGGAQFNDAALEVAQAVLHFNPDPEASDKKERHKLNPMDWTTSLSPTPRIPEWNYIQILDDGIRPLSNRFPRRTAQSLLRATRQLLNFSFHESKLTQGTINDISEIWCRRLDRPDDHQEAKGALVRSLAYACEQVYEQEPALVNDIDSTLRNEKWLIFTRLRQHLYAKYPSIHTKPWIREFILGHPDYAKWEHHFEFQIMIQNACKTLGGTLLTEAELTTIFDSILSGPSEKQARENMGEHFTDEGWRQRTDYFHRKQLQPFSPVLFGKYKERYEALTATAVDPLTDDDYSPVSIGRSGSVSYRSPRPPEDLANLSDEELLAYINDWQDSHSDAKDWLIEINVSALAGAFETVLRQYIFPDPVRMAFWLVNRERIARPIYVRYFIKALQEEAKAANFVHLAAAFDVCSWVLTHPDESFEAADSRPSEESRDHPAWRNVRRGVVDFVGACVSKDAKTPITARAELTNLLTTLCTQSDYRIDHGKSTFLNHRDYLSDAINNTRGIALDNVIDLGFWIRRQVPGAPMPELAKILGQRFSVTDTLPITLPEYALMGRQFSNLTALDDPWVVANKALLFPATNREAWETAFGTFVRFNSPHRRPFEILRDDYILALDQFDAATDDDEGRKGWSDSLGQHLFMFYVWGIYPLTGPESLIDRFYSKTNGQPKRWAQLFDHAGRLLRTTTENLDQSIKDRIVAFAEWRLTKRNKEELTAYTFWLEAKSLDARWRLEMFSKILDNTPSRDIGTSLKLDALNDLLTAYPDLVVECLAKITRGLASGDFVYLQAEKVKPILNTGFLSQNQITVKHATDARENLLRAGRSEFLDQ